MKRIFTGIMRLIILPFIASLASCGGGGGGGAAPTQVVLPLQSAYQALIANGFAKTFTVQSTSVISTPINGVTQVINVSCTGSGNDGATPANVAATFEGKAALSAVRTMGVTITNCTGSAPLPGGTATVSQSVISAMTVSATLYVDSSYAPLGFNSAGNQYGVTTAPVLIPATVTVGATGSIGTQNLYTDSSKSVGAGKDVLSYVIEPDTANTAIVNLITKSYDTLGQLVLTQQERFRLANTGALTPVSVDLQDVAAKHIMITYQ